MHRSESRFRIRYLLPVALLFHFCSRQPAPEEMNCINIRIEGFVRDTIRLLGFVDNGKPVEVYSEFPGEIRDIRHMPGDDIDSGDVLLTIASVTARNNTEVGQQIISEQKSRLRMAEDRFKRLQVLHSKGLSSKIELSDAKSELEIAEAQLKAAILRNNVKHSSLIDVKSPCRGRIGDLYAVSNQQITEKSLGDPLVTIFGNDASEVVFVVPPALMRHVESGAEVSCDFDYTAVPGRIRHISHRKVVEIMTFFATVDLRPDILTCVPGEMCEVQLLTSQYYPIWKVPMSYVVNLSGAPYVYMNRGNGPEKVTVSPMGNRNDTVLVAGLVDSTAVLQAPEMVTK